MPLFGAPVEGHGTPWRGTLRLVSKCFYSANRRANMDPNTMFLAAAIRASSNWQRNKTQVPMAKRMDFKSI